MSDDLRLLADSNGGYLHRSDLLDLGESDTAIRSAVRSGLLTRIRVGTYAFTDTFTALDPTARHLVLARSVADKFPSGAVALSHHSAAAAHGLALYDVDLSVVHLTRLDHGAGRSESGVHHHRRVDGEAVVADDGRLCVTPSVAAWQVACSTSSRGALVVMDSGLNLGLVGVDQLTDTAGRFTHWHGARLARLVIRLTDPGAESAAETLYRYVCIEHHLPRPVTQYVVTNADGEFVARTDLGFPDYCHVAEMDGVAKYIRHLHPNETPADVVVREKIREDLIREQQLGVSRALYRDVQPLASRFCAARLRQDLDTSHSLYARGRRFIV